MTGIDAARTLEQELIRLRAALDASQRRERELADFVEHAVVPLNWVGPDGIILWANQAELDLLGYRSEEYLGRPVAEFHVDPATAESLLRHMHDGEVIRDHAARLRCRNGSIKDVLIDSSVYREDGRFVHARCFTRDVTASVAVEQELHRSEERFRLAARASENLVWDWDLVRHRVTWAGNSAPFLGALGAGPDDDYRAWISRVHPDDLAGTQAVARAAMQGGAESWEHEYRFRRLDGSWAQMLERAYIVRDAGRNVVRVVGAMHDVTSSHAAERTNLHLAAIVSSSSDAIVSKTLEGVVTSWNAAAERLFGYSAAEMVGCSIFTLIPPGLHPAERELLERIRRGEKAELLETERIRKDGSRILVSVSVSPVFDAARTVIGASSIKRDITERKQAEVELSRREERYRALVTATSSVVWTADSESRFIEPQPSWQEYTGQPWQEHAGLGWTEAVHPDDRGAIHTAWLRAQAGRLDYEAQARIWSAIHRGYRHTIIRGAAVRAGDGSVREWIGTVTDVEDKWVTEERLRHAERIESVGRLAGGIAHEANNQMTVVLGAADFLLRASLPERVREDVEHIRRAARRTANITQQLLAFSRRQVLQPQDVELNAVVTGMEPIIRRALGEASRLVLRLDPEPGEVEADPGQLEQVLLNLALNARDAMPDGGVLTIETSTVVLDERYASTKPVERVPPGPYALLMVSDTGRGIEPVALSHIFEPFFTTKDVGQGTGLGLATVYGIVKQSGGFVWAYSEPGHGTAFKVYLPLLPSSAARIASAVTAPDAMGHEVVLLAEDEAAVRGILARSLRDYGYVVLEARDGAEALQIADRLAEAPGLLIADVVMPRIGGRTLAQRLTLRWPHLSVLFTSGYTGFDAISRGLLDEGREFVQKPLDPETLARKVREMLDAGAQQPPPDPQGTTRTST